MNKIYKVIWSKVRNCYVVVSELAKRNGKSKAAKTDGLNRRNRLTDLLSFNTPALTKAVMTMLVAGMIAMPNVAGAGTAYQSNTQIGNASAGGGDNASAYGNNATASGTNSTAVGGGSQATGTGTIAVGQGAKATKASADDKEPTGAIAVGYGSAAYADNSVVVGRKANAAGQSAIAVGFNALAAMTYEEAQNTTYGELNQTIKTDSVFADTTVLTATNYKTLVDALTGLSTTGSAVKKEAATSYLTQLNTRVTALMKIKGDYAIAVGDNARAIAHAAITVGSNAKVATMNQNEAQSTAYNEMSSAIRNNPALAGTAVQTANNYTQLVTALDALSTSGTDEQKAAANNYLNQLNTTVTELMSMRANYAIAAGYDAKAFAQDSIAVGHSSQVIGKDAIAVGRSSQALGQDSIVVGRQANARGAYSVSIGQGARNRTAYGIAIGVSAGISRASKTTLPPAGGLTEGTGAIAIGYKTSNYSYGTFQSDDNYEVVKNTVAIGTQVHTHAQYAVAIGAYTDATAERSFALGTASTNNSSSHKGARAGGQGSVVIGDQAEAFSDYFIENKFPGADDLGRITDTNANDAVAIGTQAHVMAKNAVAMGGNISYTGLNNDPYHVTRFTTIYGKKETGEEIGAFVGEGADAGIAIGGASGTIKYDADTKTTTITIESQAAATYGMRGIAIGSGALVANLSDYDSIAKIINSPAYITAKTKYETALSTYTNALNDCSVKTATYESLKSAFDTNYPTKPAKGDDLYPQYLLDEAELEAAESAMETAKTAVNDAHDNLAGPLAAYELQRKRIDNVEAEDAIKVEDAVAIGANAKAGIARSIAMGSDSVTKDSDEAGTVTGVIGYDMGTGNPYAKDGRFSPTWMSTAGAFSVGGGTSDTGQIVTRRITNVAAGANDTDAVNVAQLKVAMDSTIMSSDNRNVGVGPAKERGLEIFSPYYHATGIKDAAEASSFINKYINKYGEADATAYTNQLTSELTTLTGHKERIEASIGKLNTDLTTNKAKKKALEDAGKTNKDEYNEVVALISHLESELAIQKTELTQKQTEIANKEKEITDAGTTWSTNKDLYDTRAMASGTNATAIGYKAVANGNYTIAFGKEAKAGAESAIALGTGAEVAEGATCSISIGNKTGKVNGEDVTGKAVSGTDSISLGNGNAVSGNNSIAVGTGLTVSGNNSGAFGDPSEINSPNSYSVGNGNEIGTGYTDVFALGNHITKVESNSVFLGSNSGYVPADNSSTAGRSAYDSMKIDNKSYPFAGGGNHVVGVISVGNNKNRELITRRIQNVAPGLISADSTDAINGSQLYQAMQALSIDVKGDPTETQSTNVEKSKTPAAETAPAAGGDTPGGAAAGGAAGTTMEIKLTPATTYTVTASTTTVKAGSNNIKVKEKIEPDNPKSYKYTIDLAKDINVDSVTAGDTIINKDGVKANKFTAGNTTINNDGLTIAGGSSPVNLTNAGLKVGGTTVNDNGVTIQNGPGMTKDGIDAGGKKITNVAKGEADTDAVNVGQMKDYAAASSQAINDLGDQISRTDSRSRKGIAGAAALAALHPMDFDPDDKLTFAAGVGNFRGETAAAIGAFYRPDEKVMFSIGGTFGNSENLVNAGISFSLDRKSRVTGSRTAMAKEIVELREQVAQLTALVHQIAGNQGLSLPMPPAMFPNTPENKWAYDYIESLQKQGVLSGYAGRELTRNEMAAALDRALASGAKLDERITREFAPELSRIRVVYVNGQVDGEPRTFERPRSSVHEYK